MKMSATRLSGNVIVKSRDSELARFVVALEKTRATQLDTSAFIMLQYPGREMSVEQKLTETQPGDYLQELTLMLQKYEKVTITSRYIAAALHRFTTDITMAGMSPVRLVAHLRPALRDMDAAASWARGDAVQYAAAAKWTHAAGVDTTAVFQWRYPARCVKLEVGLELKPGVVYEAQMKLDWDVDNPAAKRIAGVTAVLTAVAANPSLTLNLMCLEKHVIDVTMHGTYAAGPWQQSSQDLAGNVIVTTSLAGWERIQVALNYDWAAEDISASIIVKLPAAQEYEVIFTCSQQNQWADVEAALVVNTPISGYTANGLKIAYTVGDKFVAKGEVSWAGQAIVLDISADGNMRRKSFDLMMTMTTPFAGYGKMTANTMYSYRGQTLKSLAKAAWPGSKMGFDLSLRMPGGMSKFECKLILDTPLHYAQRIVIECANDEIAQLRQLGVKVMMKGGQQVGAGMAVTTPGGWAQFNAAVHLQTTCVVAPMIKLEVINNFSAAKIKTTVALSWREDKAWDIDLVMNTPQGLAECDGTLTINTPYTHARTLTIKGNNVYDGRTIRASLNGGWAAGKRIDGNVVITLPRARFNGVKADLDLRTPFVGYRRNKVVVVAMLAQTNEISLNIHCDDTEISAKVKGRFNRADMSAFVDVDVSTPFQGFERISAVMRHSGRLGQPIATDVNVQWAPSKKIAATFAAAFAGQVPVSCELDITTSFPSCRNMIFSLRNVITSNKIDMMVNIELNNEKLTQVELLTEFDINSYDMSGRLNLQLPSIYADEISFTWSHIGSASPEKWGVISTIKVKWSDHGVFEYRETIAIVPFTSFNLVAEVLSPMQITFELGGGIVSEGGIRFKQSLTWAEGKTIRFSASVLHDGAMEAHFISPFSPVERIQLKYFNRRDEQGARMVHADLDYGGAKKVELDVVIAMGAMRKEVSLEVKSALQLVNGGFSIVVLGAPRDFTADVTITHMAIGGKWMAQFIADTKSFAHLEISMVVDTQLEELRRIQAYVKRDVSPASREIKMGVEMPHDRFIATHKMTFDDMYDFMTVTEVEYGQGELIALEIKYVQKGQLINVDVGLKSPYEAMQDVKLVLEHAGPMTDFKSTMMLQMAVGRRVDAHAAFALTALSVHGVVQVTTPFSALRNIKVEVKHNGVWTDFDNMLMLEFNRKTFLIDNKFVKNSGQCTVNVNVVTPIAGFETIALAAEYIGPWRQIAANWRLSYPNCMIDANCKLDTRADSVSGDIAVTTTFAAMRSLKVTFDHSSKHAMNFENNVKIVLNDHEFSGLSELNWVGKQLTGKLEVHIPETYIIELNHRGGLTNFKNDASVHFHHRVITGSSGFNWQGGDVTATAALRTPFASFDRMNVEIKHENSNTGGFKSSGKITTSIPQYRNVDAEVEYKPQRSGFSATGKLDAPYMSPTNFNMMVNNEDQDMSSKFATNYGDGRSILAEAAFKNKNHKMEASASVQTPYTRKLYVELTHQGNAKNFQSSVNVQSPIVNGEWKANIKHDMTRRGFKSSAFLNAPIGQFGGSVSHHGDLSDFLTTASVNTPYRAIRSLSATVHHVGMLPNCESGAEVKYGGKVVKADVSVQVGRAGDVDAKIILRTPFRAVRKLQLVASHVKQTGRAGLCKVTLKRNDSPLASVHFKYAAGVEFELALRLDQPRAMTASMQLNLSDANKTIGCVVEWDEAAGDKIVRVDIAVKNAVGRAMVDRSALVTVSLPGRVIVVNTGYSVNGAVFRHRGALQWSAAAADNVEYNMQVVTEPGASGAAVTKAKVTVKAAAEQWICTLEHTYSHGQIYMTTIGIQGLTVHYKILTEPGKYQQMITIRHPDMMQVSIFDPAYL